MALYTLRLYTFYTELMKDELIHLPHFKPIYFYRYKIV